MRVEKRAARVVGPPVIARERAVEAGNATPRPRGHDEWAQNAPLHASGAEARGLRSAPSAENDEMISERATIRGASSAFSWPK
jgi:hypothetical protein